MKVIGLSKSEIDDLSLNDINGYVEIMNENVPKITKKNREKNQVPSEESWGWARKR